VSAEKRTRFDGWLAGICASRVFNGLVFVLLGLQLRHMVAGVIDYDFPHLAGYALALWALLMALRLGWVWASALLRHIQTGYIYHYAFTMIIGLFALLTWWFGH